jgi:hypothetical protein
MGYLYKLNPAAKSVRSPVVYELGILFLSLVKRKIPQKGETKSHHLTQQDKYFFSKYF